MILEPTKPCFKHKWLVFVSFKTEKKLLLTVNELPFCMKKAIIKFKAESCSFPDVGLVLEVGGLDNVRRFLGEIMQSQI